MNYLLSNMDSLLDNQTNNPDQFLITIVLLAFFVGCFLFIYLGKKYEIKKTAMIKEMLDKDPSLKVEYRYFINLNESNYIFEQKTTRNSWINLILYFIIFFLSADLISSILIGIYCSKTGLTLDTIRQSETLQDEMSKVLTPYLELVIYALLAISLVIVSFNMIKTDLHKKDKIFKNALWGWLFIYAGSIMGSIILTSLGITTDSTNEETINEIIKDTTNIGPLLIICFVTIILAPIVEELVFRKSIFNLCKNNTRKGLVVSSLCFGAIHVINPIINALLLGQPYLNIVKELSYIIIYSLMGAGLGLTYIKSNRNIITTIVAHMINNLISMIVSIVAIKFGIM